ncbi:MAG: SUMF1/EgtB/PvdO family nonheme iron enzyme [Prosthecobacter sp.]
MNDTAHILGKEKRLLARMLPHPQGTEDAGDWIGPYRLVECIGEGGFGMVWHAEQEEPVRREVALKVIKLGMDTAQVLGRFQLERQTLAGLDHPHIATLLDAGTSSDGRPWFAMELVHGMPITQWCQTHATTLEARLRLFIEVCLAVHHAHERGILHRDLKPSNVLMTKIDGRPVPKVIDFGIAKALHADRLADFSALTQGEQVLGTPLYMSPEQIEGGRRLDARSDVYALGVLLYELLTTETPFDLSAVEDRGLSAVQDLILDTVPERPSVRLRRSSGSKATTKTSRGRQELSADLDWITMRALEKDRLRRYQTAAEFASDVRRYLENKPIVARPPSVAYVAGRWFKRHRRGTLAAGIGAALTLTVWAASVWYAAEQAKKPRAIVLAQDGTFTNDLGMKFVDVPGTDVLMCVHETRFKDFQAYAKEVPGAVAIWSTGEERGLDQIVKDRANHPVIRVNWEECQSFCAWLSKKERRVYRLPTDREWSHAIGQGSEEKWAPETAPADMARNMTDFPWGTGWPPPAGAGNYSDEARKRGTPTDEPCLSGYDDGFFTTAPVMTFKPNKLGIHDLSGNVAEWVEDWWDGRRKGHAIRGASWADSKREKLLSSWRWSGPKVIMNPGLGFRCVLERRPTFHTSLPVIVENPWQPRFPKTMKPEEAAKAGLTNSLGMKFVPVPGTDVLFCIHETRRKDYVAFDHEVPQSGAGLQWKQQHWGDEPTGMREDDPVSGVNCNEAQAFCAWLSKKEKRLYRLPSDAEWSVAVGIGDLESLTRDGTPEFLNGVSTGVFPFGSTYPPTTGQRVGNYADLAHRKAFPTADIIEGYDDGHATSAPVMSFKPNILGLYDLGGNVTEWTESWFNARGTHKALRGGSWEDFSLDGLPSGRRFSSRPEIHRASYGFRCVLVGDLPDPNLSPPPRKFPEPLPETDVRARSVTNSLGMKFVPVPGADVLFCVHETRRQDYAAYACHFMDGSGPSSAWMIQQRDGHPAGAEDDHPVVGMSWEDAKGFCDWISRREGRLYRLPTDREWSVAAGLGSHEPQGKTLEQLGQAARKDLPDGGAFPPHGSMGNYADEQFGRAIANASWIKGCDDGFITTAPVMSFKASPFGLFDLGGNALEWCEDLSGAQDSKRVQRGGSWAHNALSDLASTKRFFEAPHVRNYRHGFRCVLVPGGSAPPPPGQEPVKLMQPVAPARPPHPGAVSALQARQKPAFPEALTLAQAEQQAFTNSLGMKLLPVGGTSALFCIHETRYKDYAAYAASAPDVAPSWKNQIVDKVEITERNQDHPVFGVSWQDAQAFCAWLSAKEGRIYRLPSDREWSFAAGIGAHETWTENTTPQTIFKGQNHFPWEGVWPPPADSGNLCDEVRRSRVPRPKDTYVDGYNDGFACTAPVMSYRPSSRGLYDMAGNVWEWCEDAFDHDLRFFPLRGSSWAIPGAEWCQSSFRYPRHYTSRSPSVGFRIVLEP